MTSMTDDGRKPDISVTKDSAMTDSGVVTMKREYGGDEEECRRPIGTEAGKSLQRWNNPRINMYRYLSANFSFIIMGMNDAAYGVS